MMLCGLLWVATAWAVNMRLVEESVMAGAWIVMAFRSGICQRPRPYVPARSMPLRPSPVGRFGAASSVVTGAFGRPVPSGLQQLAEAQVVTAWVAKTPVSIAT